MTARLTIVVPAYKCGLLEGTLRAIEAQTVRDFRLLVVDDASPESVAGIVERFPRAEYVRFPDNLGGRDLVGHWNRCVELTSTELVWLFSDDDVMDPECVETLLEAADACPDHEVYRFETRIEDLSTGLVCDNPSHPETESGKDFLMAKIRDRRASYMPDHVFRRRAFLEAGATFVRFPLAWNSDDASWARLAGRHPIRTIPGPRVTWRYGGGNISSSSANCLAKAGADLSFARWATREMGIPAGILETMRAHRIRHHYTWTPGVLLERAWWRILAASSPMVVATLFWSALLDLGFRRRSRGWIRSILRGSA